MIVRLRDLKPNPFRDFEVDPIDREAVERLKTSIQEDGFWGGVVCRKDGGEIQIAAGHHRVEAAIAAGMETADVFVSEALDDTDMIRIYARENSTQRGTATGTARAGSVAAALKKAAYEFLYLQNSAGKGGRVKNGIGRDEILKYLSDDPGTSSYTVSEDLKSLKLSGHYARIIGQVRDQIQAKLVRAQQEAAAARLAAEQARQEEQEQAAASEAKAWEQEAEQAALALERAEEETERASEQEITFDFKGVAQHLKNPLQIKAFREMITGEALSEIVPVDQQADVAARIVDLARKSEGEQADISGAFIRDKLYTLILDLFRTRHHRPMTDDEEERYLFGEWETLARERQNIFLSALRGAKIQGSKLIDHLKTIPAGKHFEVSDDVKALAIEVARVLSDLEEKA